MCVPYKRRNENNIQSSNVMQGCILIPPSRRISENVISIQHYTEKVEQNVNDQTQSEPKWTDIVTGRQKRTANSRHKNIYRIPVINNHYKLPCSSDVSKT
jgi:hypothetical protein